MTNDSPRDGIHESDSEDFIKVTPEELGEKLRRVKALATNGTVEAGGDLIVNAYSDRFQAGKPSMRWKKLVRKALARLNAPHVQVISVPIEQDDSVLQPWNVRLRGVPAMIAFKAGQAVPVQYLGAPHRDKLPELTAWINKSLGLSRDPVKAPCDDDSTSQG
jgi:hypothetical protein